MQRVCFTFEIYEGAEDEYKRRHDEIWPELVELIEESGLKNYTLFRRGTQVIAYVEAHPDLDTAFANIAGLRGQRPLVQVVRGGHRQPHRLRRQPLLRRRGLAPRLSFSESPGGRQTRPTTRLSSGRRDSARRSRR